MMVNTVNTMNVVDKAIEFFNPDQKPIIMADQPLFALLKQLQYLFPERHGEKKIFVMMGGLQC